MPAGHAGRLYLPATEGADQLVEERRSKFLETLDHLGPEVREGLLGIHGSLAFPTELLECLEWRSGEELRPRPEPEFEARLASEFPDWQVSATSLLKAIRKWGRTWNLNDEWLIEAAFGWLVSYAVTLRETKSHLFALQASRAAGLGWQFRFYRDVGVASPQGFLAKLLDTASEYFAEAERSARNIRSIGDAVVHAAQNPLEVVHPKAWDPVGGESRSEAKRRLITWLRRLVDEHLDEAEEAALSHGARPIPRKRARRHGTEATHFEWLVRFQVPMLPGKRPETLEEIAATPYLGNSDRGGKEPRTVQDAIRRTAEEIGLTRRSVS